MLRPSGNKPWIYYTFTEENLYKCTWGELERNEVQNTGESVEFLSWIHINFHLLSHTFYWKKNVTIYVCNTFDEWHWHRKYASIGITLWTVMQMHQTWNRSSAHHNPPKMHFSRNQIGLIVAHDHNNTNKNRLLHLLYEQIWYTLFGYCLIVSFLFVCCKLFSSLGTRLIAYP